MKFFVNYISDGFQILDDTYNFIWLRSDRELIKKWFTSNFPSASVEFNGPENYKEVLVKFSDVSEETYFTMLSVDGFDVDI